MMSWLCAPRLVLPDRRSALTGQDERAQSEQRGGSLLHPDRRAGAGHAGGSGRVLLQVADRVAQDEGESGGEGAGEYGCLFLCSLSQQRGDKDHKVSLIIGRIMAGKRLMLPWKPALTRLGDDFGTFVPRLSYFLFSLCWDCLNPLNAVCIKFDTWTFGDRYLINVMQ